jgi:hypothetical protein
MSDLKVDEQRAAQQRAATRTAIILAVLAVALYAWVFISRL